MTKNNENAKFAKKTSKILKTPKMPKMLNNKINKNRGIYIANRSLEQMCGLERTFL